MTDTWNPKDTGVLHIQCDKSKALRRREVRIYELISETTDKKLGESKDLPSAVQKAKVLGSIHRTKVLIQPRRS